LLERWKLHGKKIFLYVGTHAFYHGLENLIEAATLLRGRDDLAFLMIGDGPERPRLEKMCADRGLKNVVFGRSPYGEMDRLYSIAYASVATLRKMEVAKGMRLSKIFPSLSCAVPVIYAGEGEAAELLRDYECGLLSPPEDPVLLSQAIEALAASPETRDRLGRAGRVLVEKDYSWDCIIDRWLQEIGILSNNSSRQ
jgi:glycosyltransferase involved in cell wall biosynthesis